MDIKPKQKYKVQEVIQKVNIEPMMNEHQHYITYKMNGVYKKKDIKDIMQIMQQQKNVLNKYIIF